MGQSTSTCLPAFDEEMYEHDQLSHIIQGVNNKGQLKDASFYKLICFVVVVKPMRKTARLEVQQNIFLQKNGKGLIEVQRKGEPSY